MNILLIESDAVTAARLTWELLEHDLTRVKTPSQACEQLQNGRCFDVIVCRPALPPTETATVARATKELLDEAVLLVTDETDGTRLLALVERERIARSLATTQPIKALLQLPAP